MSSVDVTSPPITTVARGAALDRSSYIRIGDERIPQARNRGRRSVHCRLRTRRVRGAPRGADTGRAPRGRERGAQPGGRSRRAGAAQLDRALGRGRSRSPLCVAHQGWRVVGARDDRERPGLVRELGGLPLLSPRCRTGRSSPIGSRRADPAPSPTTCTSPLRATPAGPGARRSCQEVRDMSVVRFAGGRWTEPRTVARDGWQINGCPVNGPAIAAAERQVPWRGSRRPTRSHG